MCLHDTSAVWQCLQHALCENCAYLYHVCIRVTISVFILSVYDLHIIPLHVLHVLLCAQPRILALHTKFGRTSLTRRSALANNPLTPPHLAHPYRGSKRKNSLRTTSLILVSPGLCFFYEFAPHWVLLAMAVASGL